MPPRRYTTSSEDYNEPRIYVNNMNTRHATVSIPSRPPKMQRPPGTHDDTTGDDYANGASGDVRDVAGVHSTTSILASRPAGSISAAAPPGVVQVLGDDLHPNLEQVYKRIMRRLQRQLNYEEVSRVSLAAQFGVQPNDRFEDVSSHTAGSRSTRGPADGEDVAPLHRVASSAALSLFQEDSGFPSSGSTTAGPTPTQRSGGTRQQAGSGGGFPLNTTSVNASPSFIIRYQNDSKAEDAIADDDERALAQQPCPMTLRLVVQHVIETLINKMYMAERGSLKDCLRFTFESRALLDRLLKEIPMYAQYQEEDSIAVDSTCVGGSRRSIASGGPMSGLQLQNLYQEFRKQPIVLPRATFVQNPNSGAVHAQLGHAQEEALHTAHGGHSSSSQSVNDALPPTNRSVSFSQQQQQQRLSKVRGLSPQYATFASQLVGTAAGSDNASSNGEKESGQEEEEHPALPQGYGRSARLASAEDHEVSPGLLGLGEAGSGTATMTNIPWVESGGAGCLVSPSSSTIGQRGTQGSGRNAAAASRQAEYEAYCFRERRQTQMTSVATLTEENGSNIVTVAAYEKLEEYAKDLEVKLAEANRLKGEVENKLLFEGSYTERKARIIDYLRKTLFRECNMLRSQLAFAAQKEAQMRDRLISSTQVGSGVYNSNNTNSNAGGNANAALAGSVPGANRSFANSMRTHAPARFPISASSNSVAPTSPRSGQPVLTPTDASCGNFITTASPGGTPAAGLELSLGGGAGSPNTTTQPQSPSAAAAAAVNDNTNNSSASQDSAWKSKPPANAAAAAAAATTAAYNTATSDIISIQSLLDLALLAVEQGEVFPMSASAAMEFQPDVLRECMQKDIKTQGNELRSEFEEKHKQLKNNVLMMKVKHGYVLMAKDQEIERLQRLMDLSYVEKTLTENIHDLRNELWKVKNHVQEQIQGFRVMVATTITSVLNRTKLSDAIIVENTQLHNTLDAMKDMIDSAVSLFLPMLTPEYTLGYHPWPVKLRNSLDPLSHLIQMRYGTTEVVKLRPQMSLLSGVYLAIHKVATERLVVPDTSRPATGKYLRVLCAGILLSPMSTTEVLHEVRQRYSTEGQITKKLARVNMKILWNVYRQRTYVDRSVGAMLEGGLDPHTTTLPVAGMVNLLAVERGNLMKTRAALQKERLDNAREVYRLWKERQVDIFDGYPPPPLVPNRLTLLSEAQALAKEGEQNPGMAVSMRRRLRSSGQIGQSGRNSVIMGRPSLTSTVSRSTLVNAASQQRVGADERSSMSTSGGLSENAFASHVFGSGGEESARKNRQSTIISEFLQASEGSV